MKKSYVIKMLIVILLVGVLTLQFMSSKVAAIDLNQLGSEIGDQNGVTSGIPQNTNTNTNTNTNMNTNTNTNNGNVNIPSNTNTNTNTNINTNTNTNTNKNNTALPQTGANENIILVLIGICTVAAVVALRKSKEFYM